MNAKQKARRDKARRKQQAEVQAVKTPPPVRITALLSWYDESPAWLSATIASLAKIDVDHLVAVDGAYALYPGGKPKSPAEQHEAITETALGLGIGLTLHVPQTVWAGNEVEKRSALFALGEHSTTPEDWYMVMDADELLYHCPADTRQRLADAEQDAAMVTFLNRAVTPDELAGQFHWDPISRVQVPIFFRAIRGLRVNGNHFTYETPDGRKLWGMGDRDSAGTVEDFYDLSDLTIEHRTAQRALHRRKQQKDYYEKRERIGIEWPACYFCQEPSVVTLPYKPEIADNGMIEAQQIGVCEAHTEKVVRQTHAIMARKGIPADFFQHNAPLDSIKAMAA